MRERQFDATRDECQCQIRRFCSGNSSCLSIRDQCLSSVHQILSDGAVRVDNDMSSVRRVDCELCDGAGERGGVDDGGDENVGRDF